MTISQLKLLAVHGDEGVVHPHLPESARHLLGEAGHPAQPEQLHRPPEAVRVGGLGEEVCTSRMFVEILS